VTFFVSHLSQDIIPELADVLHHPHPVSGSNTKVDPLDNDQPGMFSSPFLIFNRVISMHFSASIKLLIQSLLNTGNKFQNTNTPLFGTFKNTFCTGNLEVSATLTVAISAKTASSSYWSFGFLRVTVRICDPQLSDSSPFNAHTVAGMPQMLLISSDRRLKNARTSVFG
jgi:hypothetical protein